MVKEVKIRRAQVKDALILSALAGATNYETYFETDEPEDLAKYIADYFNPSQMKIELEDKNSTFFLAEIGGKAVGYAKLLEGKPVECVRNENTIELQRIYVLEKLIRRGVGKILLEKCLEEARSRNFDSLWPKVFDLNARAIEFYRRQNFEHIGEDGFYYGEQRFTCLVMRIII